MSEKNGGGPAFPREDYQCNGGGGNLGQEGMTLRDYFAAKAVGVAFKFYEDGYCGNDGELDDKSSAVVAAVAYELADAMLAERAK